MTEAVATGLTPCRVDSRSAALNSSALDLTTVRQPLEASGRLALRMVLEQLAGRDDTGETVLDLTLVPRASTTGVVPVPESPAQQRP